MPADLLSHLKQTLKSRGSLSLWYANAYGGVLTSAQKDELLICSRIAKAKYDATK